MRRAPQGRQSRAARFLSALPGLKFSSTRIQGLRFASPLATLFHASGVQLQRAPERQTLRTESVFSAERRDFEALKTGCAERRRGHMREPPQTRPDARSAGGAGQTQEHRRRGPDAGAPEARPEGSQGRVRAERARCPWIK